MLNKLNDSPQLVSGVAVILTIIAGWFVYQHFSDDGREGIKAKWMYDLNTNRLILADFEEASPSNINNATVDLVGLGTVGSVLEVGVYTCGDPSDVRAGMSIEELASVDATVVYFATTTDRFGTGSQELDLITADTESGVWIGAESSAGNKMRSDARLGLCQSGDKAIYCVP
ncbi:hypothetical protein [Algisphaera agarilytica]|uniref:Uncharacterized protein n=1 Tax=Algisphaera agarilytica TaxID=1385975 RepID=A0A7X0H4V6_9BACT|nr:hypothetical protein [Algisphaera agarilytica]MBB6429133.1 hypothetical protein [Algisphaera agarilytica]